MVRSLTDAGSGSLPVATFVVTILFTIIVTMVVGLRVLAAWIRRRSLKLHDYFIFVALIASIGGCAMSAVALYHGGLGRHITDVSLDEMIVLLKCLNGASVIWTVSTAAVKASVLSLLWHLFPRKSFRYAVYATSVLVGLFFVGFVIEPFIICIPYSHYWRMIYDPEGGWCGNQFSEEIAAASANMAIDLVLVILPMPVLWDLKMPTAKKVRVSAILSLGVLIMCVNIARIIYTTYASRIDFTYSAAFEFILGQLEVWIGIVVACLPLLGPLRPARKAGEKPTFPSSGFKSGTSWGSKLRLFSLNSTRGSGSKSGSEQSSKASASNMQSQNSGITATTVTTVSTADRTYSAENINDVYMGQADYQVVKLDRPLRAGSHGTDASSQSSEKDQKKDYEMV